MAIDVGIGIGKAIINSIENNAVYTLKLEITD
jgi:hypothetical protein